MSSHLENGPAHTHGSCTCLSHRRVQRCGWHILWHLRLPASGSKMTAALFKSLPPFCIPALSLDVNYQVSCPFLQYTLHTPANTHTHTHTFQESESCHIFKVKKEEEEAADGRGSWGHHTFTLFPSSTNLRAVHGAALQGHLVFSLLQLGANQGRKVKGHSSLPSFPTFSRGTETQLRVIRASAPGGSCLNGTNAKCDCRDVKSPRDSSHSKGTHLFDWQMGFIWLR